MREFFKTNVVLFAGKVPATGISACLVAAAAILVTAFSSQPASADQCVANPANLNCISSVRTYERVYSQTRRRIVWGPPRRWETYKHEVYGMWARVDGAWRLGLQMRKDTLLYGVQPQDAFARDRGNRSRPQEITGMSLNWKGDAFGLYNKNAFSETVDPDYVEFDADVSLDVNLGNSPTVDIEFSDATARRNGGTFGANTATEINDRFDVEDVPLGSNGIAAQTVGRGGGHSVNVRFAGANHEAMGGSVVPFDYVSPLGIFRRGQAIFVGKRQKD